MKISLRAHGELRRHLGDRDVGELELPAGATVDDAVRALAVDERYLWLVAVNGAVADRDRALEEGDIVELIAPADGGS